MREKRVQMAVRRALQAHAPYPNSPLPSPSSHNGKHHNLALGLALGLSLALLIATIVLAWVIYHRLKTSRTSPYDLNTSKTLQKFSYRQLKQATVNFSESQKLGQGGFGAVYKGQLRTGVEVAVKRIDVSSVQGEVAFQNEVSIIGKITSPHIVKLLGFCAHGPRRLLVYEYMANRSLQEALFDEVYAVRLDWDMRFRIVLNTAEGLAYLHGKCDPPVIHGDVKPSNVLLDGEFKAKLADFGLARVRSEESILEVQTQEAQREAVEKERMRYERVVRDRARRQRRREEAERKKHQTQNVVEDGGNKRSHHQDPSMEFAFEPNPEGGGERKSSASMFDGLSTEEETSGIMLDSPCSKGGNSTPTSILRHKMGASPPTIRGALPELVSECSPVSAPAVGTDATDTEEISWQDCDESRSYPQSPMSVTKLEIRSDMDGDNFLSAEEGETDMEKSVILSMDGTGEEGWSTVSPSQPDLDFTLEASSAGQNGEVRKGLGRKEKKVGRSWSRDWWRKHQQRGNGHGGHGNGNGNGLGDGDGGGGNNNGNGLDVDVKDAEIHQGTMSMKEQLQKSEELNEMEGDGTTRRSKSRTAERRQRSRSSGWVGSFIGEMSKVDSKRQKLPAKQHHDKLKGREWWREEYCEELSNKSREFRKVEKSNKHEGGNRSSRRHKKDDYTKWIRDFSQEYGPELGMHSKNHHSKNLEVRRENRKSRSRREEFWSGDSYRGVSSTPSMRGTICYVAPEYGGAGLLSEKSDVYSFGVLLLVLIAGRRPLQVTASPMSDFERANLISWARLLAQSGNILDLVDPSLQSTAYSEDQAVMCITVALLCLQRLPTARPSMSDIVKILNGEFEVPDLPFEFSPSPPGFKSRRKPSAEEIVMLSEPPITV